MDELAIRCSDRSMLLLLIPIVIGMLDQPAPIARPRSDEIKPRCCCEDAWFNNHDSHFGVHHTLP